MSFSIIIKDQSDDFDVGTPVVKLSNNKIVYCLNHDELTNIISDELLKKKINVNEDDIEELVNKRFEYRDLYPINGAKEMKLIPLICENDEKQRDVVLINGSSGLGKSHFCSDYAKIFNKFYPESEVFLISSKPVDQDENLSSIKNLSVFPIEELEDFSTDPSPYLSFVSESGQSLIIFDDCEGMQRKLQKNVDSLMRSILTCGRSKRIYCLISKHMKNDKDSTAICWIEATKYVLFPSGTMDISTQYCLNKIGVLNPSMKDAERNEVRKFINGDPKNGIKSPRCILFNLGKNKFMINPRVGIRRF